MAKSALEESLARQIEEHDLPTPRQQVLFAKESMGRLWRADFLFPEHKLLIEVDGGTYTGGRHVTGSGYRKDAEKLNAAVLMGYTVLRFDGGMVKDGTAIRTIKQALDAKGAA